MDLGLNGKRAIVTGGRRGIGRAIAAAFAAEGAEVIIASREAEALEKAAAELRASGGAVQARTVDTSSTESVAALVDWAVATLGGVDILVNNATTVISGPSSTLDSTPEAVAAGFDDKVLGYLRCARAVLPHMVEQRWGRVINVGNNGKKLGEAFNQIQDELRTQYLASYTPTNLKLDGSFRTLNVTCGKDTKVQTRKGYYALADGNSE